MFLHFFFLSFPILPSFSAPFFRSILCSEWRRCWWMRWWRWVGGATWSWAPTMRRAPSGQQPGYEPRDSRSTQVYTLAHSVRNKQMWKCITPSKLWNENILMPMYMVNFFLNNNQKYIELTLNSCTYCRFMCTDT